MIEFSLQSFAILLEGSHVSWYTDSQAAAKVVEVGSMKFDLHSIARSIFNICIQSGIHLEVQWIPLSLNQQADYISRLIDIDDWHIANEFFYLLTGIGVLTLLIVLPIFIITISLNAFQDFGIPPLPVLISSFSLFAGRIASSFHQWVLSPTFCII